MTVAVDGAGALHASQSACRAAEVQPALRGIGLSCTLGGRRIIDGLSIALTPGEILLLVGPNGAGKTTLLRLLSGSLRAADGGEVWLDAQEISHLPLYERARRGVGYLPQGPSVFVGMTVRQNIDVVLRLRGMRGSQRREQVETLIDSFGLSGVQQQLAARLSGGERRRLELARIVALQPRVVLLDEPFAGLDREAAVALSQRIAALAAQGAAVLMAEHHVQQALTIARRACILVEGRILAAGEPAEIARRYGLGDTTVERLDGGGVGSSVWHSK